MDKKYLIRTLIIVFAYFLSGMISFAISPENDIVTVVIFSAEGIALASAIIYGKRVWLAIFIGQFFLVYYNGMEWQPSLGIALVNSIEALLAVIVFHKLKLNKDLSTFKDILGLILIIIFFLQPFSATFGNLVLIAYKVIEPSDYLHNLMFWFIGNSMGQLLITPVILLLHANIKKSDLIQLAIVALASIILSFIVLKFYPITQHLLLLGVTIFFILTLSYILGVHYGAFATFIIAYISLYLTHNNIGIFTGGSPIDNIINLNSYFLFQILLVLLFGTLLSDMKNKANRLQLLVKQELNKNREQQFHMLQRDRLALKGEMISMIAHQWKQPLNNLSLIHQMILLEYENNRLNKDVMLQFDSDSKRQIKQMSKTITDFTNFFSPEKNSQKFYIKDTLMQSLSLLRPIFDIERIKTNLDIESQSDILLDGYPNELGQMFINILNNAKDALIEKDIINREIWISSKRVDDNIYLYIEDNAGGIPSDIINKIFDPYFSTKSKNGTGLGLYMSKMIIEEHMSGKLEVYNSDKGAIFKTTLPILINS
jgi:signal transduction histidine kinase